MARIESSIEVKMELQRVYLVFFPIATYKRIDDVAILRVFGISVYKRVGDLESILGITRTRGAVRDAS